MYQKKILNILIAIVFITGLSFQPALAYEFMNDSGLSNTAVGAGYGGSSVWNSPAYIIARVIKILLGFLGVIFLGLMMYGGYIWMMARGNQAEVDKAKKLIESAIIGLVIVLAAYAITMFVARWLVPITTSGVYIPEGY